MTSLFPIEEYRRLQYKRKHAKDEAEESAILDQMDGAWKALNEEERRKIEAEAVHLAPLYRRPKLKPEDVKPGMEFSMIDITSYWVHVDAIDGPDACCTYFTCFTGGKTKERLVDLVNTLVYERIK